MYKKLKYYQQIFDELIPDSKHKKFRKFSKIVDVKSFFGDLKLVDLNAYKILKEKNCNFKEVELLIGDYMIEYYFLTKKIQKKLKQYNHQAFNNIIIENKLINKLKKIKKNSINFFELQKKQKN